MPHRYAISVRQEVRAFSGSICPPSSNPTVATEWVAYNVASSAYQNQPW